MSDKSGIQWTDATWNPVRGCSRVSEGCRNCYAERYAQRFANAGQPFEGFARGGEGPPRWTGKVELIPEKLDQPLRWKKPRRIFVNSMSDLFHESLPDEAIDRVFAVMALAPQHTFQILTKRPERMRAYVTGVIPEGVAARIADRMREMSQQAPSSVKVYPVGPMVDGSPEFGYRWFIHPWPLPNIWLGVSVEDQATADERVPLLLSTPAAVRFVSYEPALGPVVFEEEWLWHSPGGLLDWIIVGGESGPGARPFHVAWAESARDQCRAAGVPFFLKQLGAYPWWANATAHPISHARNKNDDPTEWPEDLRVREFPR